MKKKIRNVGIAALLLCGAACSKAPDVDKIPVGQDVAVTKSNGGVVEGTVSSKDSGNLQVTSGDTTKSIPKGEIVDVANVDKGKEPSLPRAAEFREYTVPAGTRLSLTLATGISSVGSEVEDPIEATLSKPVLVAGTEVLPAGSVLKGTVSAAKESGRVKGRASVAVRFTSLTVPGRGDRYDIDASYSQIARATKGDDAKKIGIGAGAGAIVGAILGGGSGAAKGALVGGGAGTGVVLATKGKETSLPAGAAVRVALRKAVEVRVPIK